MIQFPQGEHEMMDWMQAPPAFSEDWAAEWRKLDSTVDDRRVQAAAERGFRWSGK